MTGLPEWMQTASRSRDLGPDDTDTVTLPDVSGEVRDCLALWASQAEAAGAAADTKAGTLLGWSGTALALLVTVLAASGTNPHRAGTLALVVGLTGLLALIGAVAALVYAIRPRMGARHSSASGDYSFLTWATVGPEVVLSLASQDSQDVTDPARAVDRVQILATIALVKHQLVRTACSLLLASLVLLSAAAVAVVVGGAR